MEIISINTENCNLEELKAGDLVEISGTIFTARDAAHKRMDDMIKDGKPLPFSISNSFIYYTGATPKKDGEVFGSCGPTTSKRMDKYTPTLLDMGLKGIIGKGIRSNKVIEAIKRNKAVYFVAIGGAGAFYKSSIKEASIVAFPDLLSEAIYKLRVEGFRCIVGIDSTGKSIF